MKKQKDGDYEYVDVEPLTPLPQQVYKLDGISQTFLVPQYLVDKCIALKHDLLVIDDNDTQIILSPLDLLTDTLETDGKTFKVRYRFDQIDYRIDNLHKGLTDIELNLLEKFGASWFTALREYITQDSFVSLLREINKLRNTQTIYPRQDQIFRAFELTNFDFVETCMLLQDPYPGKNKRGIPYANGLATATDTEDKPESLIQMQRAMRVDMDYPDSMVLQNDLLHLVEQNILLLNSSLTVVEGKANSHTKLWQDFIAHVIILLAERNKPCIFILLGAQAKSFMKYIGKEFENTVLTQSHPVSASYNNSHWNSNGLFKVASDTSHLYFNKGIKWIL